MSQQVAIRTEKLTKRFGNYNAVNKVDLQIKVGEVYGLIGANGAGKTTLLSLLVTAEEATSGDIYINDYRLLRDDDNLKIKRCLAYLPDDFPIYSDLTVWKYLNYFARLYRLKESERKKRLHEVLELVGLTKEKNKLTSKLSRGMKQRLSLARSVIHWPEILILDEPVSGLDPSKRSEFCEMIKLFQQLDMTVLISSHILSDLTEICTSIGIMDKGELIENSSLDDLYNRYTQPQIIVSPVTEADKGALENELNRYLIAENSLVTGWNENDQTNEVIVYFSGDCQEAARFLHSLVSSGIMISEFRHVKEDLDKIYDKIIKNR